MVPGLFRLSPWIPSGFRNQIVLGNVGNLVYFPSINLVFNRIKKSGNSSMLFFLDDAINGSTAKVSESWDDYKQHKKNVLKRHPALRPNDLFFSGVANSDWLLVSRNPYSRLLSAYLQKRKALWNGYSERKDKPVRWDKFPGFTEKNPQEGFRIFVSYLCSRGTRGDQHWWRQVDLLALPPEHFRFKIKLENLERELSDLLASRISGYTPTGMSSAHPSEASPKITNANKVLSSFYDKGLADMVRELYLKDFLAFGYEENIS
jgi:hypothetical protein